MDTPPKTVIFETVLGCNLRCPECAVGGKIVKRKYGQMSLAQYHVLIEKVRPYVEYLYLHLWGEPMLNKDIFQMLRHASAFTKTNISTNANLLDARMARDLIESGVSDIIVSIDGITQDTYAIYRRRGQVGAALRGLAYLVNANRRHGNRVNINPQFIVFEHNVHEMEAFGKLCRELGLSPVFKAPYLRPDSQLRATGLRQYTRRVEPDPEARRQAMRQCPNARDVLTVLLDGQVVACCYDHNGLTNFGNLYTQSLEEIWESPGYKAFRQGVRDGSPGPFCQDQCLLY